MSCCNPRNTPNRPMRKGAPGESAYEFWVSHQPVGADTSECAFLDYMKGTKGDRGESAFEFWVSQQPEGADVSDEAFLESMTGLKGDNGLSAYEFWVSQQPEGADTSTSAYFSAITGQSAYEFWVSQQPEGTDTSGAAYLLYMKGGKGDKGDSVEYVSLEKEAVPDGTEVTITSKVENQDAGFIKFVVENGEPGDKGDSVEYVSLEKEAVPDGTEVTITSKVENQDAGFIKFVVENGQPGKQGLSAYEFWVSQQPEGADTSEAAYLAFMEGKEGNGGSGVDVYVREDVSIPSDILDTYVSQGEMEQDVIDYGGAFCEYAQTLVATHIAEKRPNTIYRAWAPITIPSNMYGGDATLRIKESSGGWLVEIMYPYGKTVPLPRRMAFKPGKKLRSGLVPFPTLYGSHLVVTSFEQVEEDGSYAGYSIDGDTVFRVTVSSMMPPLSEKDFAMDDDIEGLYRLRLSGKTDNAIKCITGESTASNNGFYVSEKKPVRFVSSGNMSWSYPASAKAESAAGMLPDNVGCYVRTKVTLYGREDPKGQTPIIRLTSVPMNEKGAIIPHTLTWEPFRTKAGSSTDVFSRILVTMAEIPYYIFQLDTMEQTRAYRGSISGIPEMEEIPDDAGLDRRELGYVVEYLGYDDE